MRTLFLRFALLWMLALCMGRTAIAQNPVLDESFDAGASCDEFLMAVALQDDGRMIVAGRFTSFQGMPHTGVVRLLSDGTLDPSFGPVPLASVHEIRALALDPTGNVLIGGYFYGFDGTPINCIARLNPDGTRDLSFNPGTGADYTVEEIVVQQDGRILMAGNFREVNGITRRGIARLMPDGSLDPGFTISSGFTSLSDPDFPYVHCIALDQEGRILVGGWFDAYDGVSTGKLIRLQSSGLLDLTFTPVIETWDAEITDILVLADQRIRVAGNFSTVNGQPQGGLAGLLSTGVNDPSFISGDDIVQNVVQLMDDVNGMLITGSFWSYSGVPRHQLVSVDQNGFLETGYDIGNGFEGTLPYVHAMRRQLDSRTLVVGNFESFNGVGRIDVLRLGSATDCLGVVGGPALPGTPCDDGIFFTSNDTWSASCMCAGFDCTGTQGGNAFPGTPCDDGISWTYGDSWTVDCACQGTGQVGLSEAGPATGALALSPNPAWRDGPVHITVPANASPVDIAIMDASGRFLRAARFSGHASAPLLVPTADLDAGVYLVRVAHGATHYTLRLVMR